MAVKVGDQYQYNRKGATLLVTSIKDTKVKFSISGLSIPISGSMRLQEFTNHYVVKGKVP